MRREQVISGIILAVVLLGNSEGASASTNFPYSIEKLADAIYKAEGSIKYPYGIKSINTHGNKALARKICLNTIRNNWKRYLKTDKTPTKNEYLKFLASRYCPTNAPDNFNGINSHWMKNVEFFYNKGVANG